MSQYATSFPLNQNPISEGGAWTSGNDPLQTPVQTSGGLAFGTQTGSGSFDDSVAYLGGFPQTQTITGVVHRSGTPNGDLEIELWLRTSVGALRTGLPFGDTHTYGYEINIGIGEFGTFLQIGLFKSTNLFSGTITIADGDVVEASIVGTVITVKINGVQVAQVTDNTNAFPTGNPGIGFFRLTNGTPDDPSMFAWASITAQGFNDPEMFFGAGTTG